VTRDQFVALPLRIALGIIYDIARTPKLVDMPCPDVPKPPLFDGRLSKGKDGFVWMSEMLLRDLEWWRDAKQKTADTPEHKYADQARKAVATLTKWIAWRTLYPSDVWSGKRGDERVTAAPPSRDPGINAWGPRNDAKKPDTKNSKPAARPEDDGRDEGEGYGF
jgi:hypothetical protein